MRAAENWKDYRLLDASDGDRLERWGDVVLQRPDPQVIWQRGKDHASWGQVDALYHRSRQGGGRWETRRKLPKRWQVTYGELRFYVSPTGFKHTGLFPEQAVNWDWYGGQIRGAGRPVRVLNLFAYTGGASLACAAAGAGVTHVDASKGMVNWARENAAESGLGEKPIRWIVDDCEKYVAREIRRESFYDAVILDPPSYGRGPGGEVWKLEEKLWPLLKLCVSVLGRSPLFFALNSYTAGLAPGVMGYMLEALLPPRFGGEVHSDEIGLPIETGGVLPCGATALWCKG
ncbi:class I SAM-dependent methyltransferase [Ruminococcaceae bacterium OttesenSCG-928-I18]|nr:class I SAM-dependent methyltransferase [Ruminococcaceae bacterium OttesenSCG-928-I18]